MPACRLRLLHHQEFALPCLLDLRRCRRRLAPLLVLMSASAFGATEEPFPRYPELAPKVAFWTDIFARYSLHDSVIHPAAYPHVVLDVLHFDPELSPAQRHRQEEASKRAHRQALQRLQAARDPATLSPADRALYDRFQGIADARRFEKAAQSLRAQRGVKERTEQALAVSGAYLPSMEATFRQYALPIELTRLPIVESSFNIDAYSKSSAAGLWQFIPSSARIYMRLDEAVDERRDPWRSTDAAARHLRDDYALLGSWPLALTAYNHGRNGVARGLAEVKGKTLVDLIERYDHPRFGFASRNFYAEFLAAKDIEAEAQRYFPALVRQQPQPYAEIELSDYLPFPSVVAMSGLDREQFRRLNPALSEAVIRGQLWVPKGQRIRLPESQAPAFKRAYARLPAAERHREQRPYWRVHRVQRGDVLGRIARRYGVSVKAIQQANQLRQAGHIRIGQTLKIPPGNGVAGGPGLRKVVLRVHTVRAGETLSAIARKHRVGVRAIAQLNQLGDRHLIKPGQKLKIPG
jgi:membrane-bound lytic murein transglycosylase D